VRGLNPVTITYMAHVVTVGA